MDYFIMFLFGFATGWFALRGLVLYRMRGIKKLFEEAEAKSKATEIMVKFVRNGDHVYAYNADTDEFLAQGTTRQDIVDSLKKRFPNVTLRASPANLKEANLE